jgi:hypothetical protein
MQPVDFPYDAADPFGHIRPNGRAHTGSDWLCPTGTVVRAVLPGVVTAVGWNDGNGKYVAQSLPDGRFWSYIHLSEIAVNVGDVLSEGTPVALSGNTGTNSQGPHLHCSLSTSPSVFVGAPTLSDPYAFLESIPPTPPTPVRKKKRMFAMAAIKGESYVWAIWAPGFYYEVKQRTGLTLDEVRDQANKWNTQVVGAQPNFTITRAQANELKAMCLK